MCQVFKQHEQTAGLSSPSADSIGVSQRACIHVQIYCHNSRRVLRLSECAVAAACLATVGTACPQLVELRYRSASAVYSPQHVSARSELLHREHIMQIMQGTHQSSCIGSRCTPRLDTTPLEGIAGNVSAEFTPGDSA